jgi:hypothetical protein
VRNNLVQTLGNAEQDLLVQNGVQGVMNAFIRGNGQVPDEAILLAMQQIKTQVHTKCDQVDEYTKLLDVSCYHPRTGQKVAAKCLIPVHDTKLDSFELHDIHST